MKNFIKINGGADSALCCPVDNILSIHCDTNAKLSMTFKSSLPLNLTTIGTTAAAATKAYDEVIFSIVEDQQMAAINEILDAVNATWGGGVAEVGTNLSTITAVDSITLGVS